MTDKPKHKRRKKPVNASDTVRLALTTELITMLREDIRRREAWLKRLEDKTI
jgi:hypothetical protein